MCALLISDLFKVTSFPFVPSTSVEIESCAVVRPAGIQQIEEINVIYSTNNRLDLLRYRSFIWIFEAFSGWPIVWFSRVPSAYASSGLKNNTCMMFG